MKKKFQFSNFLWDLWCVVSIIGIWPRFLEPNMLSTTSLKLKLPNLPSSLKGLKILQFSDLHLNANTTNYFLKKIRTKIEALNPDIITFTGDFLCYSKFGDKKRLLEFFQSIPEAEYGNYAIFGNHDYSEYVCVNEEGYYDTDRKKAKKSVISSGFQRLRKKLRAKGTATSAVKNVTINQELLDLLSQTPFRLIHNETVTIPIKGAKLNICGLGEHMAGMAHPEEAFEKYEKKYPGVVLVHNPDAVPHLTDYPGEITLCGHTHGGQVNLPWMWKRFIVLENERYKHGLFKENGHWIYVNRGIGGLINFRWFCLPEMLLLELDADE